MDVSAYLLIQDSQVKSDSRKDFDRFKLPEYPHGFSAQSFNVSSSYSSLRISMMEPILEKIFSNLPIQDLKSCRHVHSFWRIEATKSLLKFKSTRKITLYSWASGAMESSKKNLPTTDTDSFVELVHSSPIFPCNNFNVSYNRLDKEIMQQFFWHHGKYINDLQIVCSDLDLLSARVSSRTLEFLLTKQVAKLESLTIQNIPQQWLSNQIDFSKLRLYHLKSFTFSDKDIKKPCASKFIQDVIISAVNLKEIYSYNCRNFLRFIKFLVKCKKSHLLKEYKFFFRTHSSPEKMDQELQTLEIVLASEPKLNSIALYLPYLTNDYLPQMVAILTKFLTVCSSTLMNIENFNCIPHVVGVKIPTLPKIKVLNYIGFGYNYKDFFDGNLHFFDSRLSFNATFPNLEEITLLESSLGRTRNEEVVQPRFVNFCPHFKVKKIVVYSYYIFPQNGVSSKVFEYLGLKFPNLSHVSFPLTFEFIEAAQFIWSHCNRLEFLEITIGWNMDSVEYAFPGIESAFTGFSIETCRHLYGMIEPEKDIEYNLSNLGTLRTKSSLLDLKNLKHLIIHFDSRYNWNKWNPRCPLLTTLTGRCAFALCPQLKVEIKAKFDFFEANPFLGVLPFVEKLDVVAH